MTESTTASSIPVKQSGIPRLSRLPLPSTNVRASPSREVVEPEIVPSTNRLRAQQSTDNLWASANERARRAPSGLTIARKKSAIGLNSNRQTSGKTQHQDASLKLHMPRPASRQKENSPSSPGEAELAMLRQLNTDAKVASPALTPLADVTLNDESSFSDRPATSSRRPPRPSLSERTIETLSQIPPSPSPGRRRSSFYNSTSPVRSHSSAGSRPGSSAANHGGTSGSMGPPSPVKQSISKIKSMSGTDMPTAGPYQRSVGSSVNFGAPTSLKANIGPVAVPSKIKSPTATKAIQRPTTSSGRPENAVTDKPKLTMSGNTSVPSLSLRPRKSLNNIRIKPSNVAQQTPMPTNPALLKKSSPTVSNSSASTDLSRTSRASSKTAASENTDIEEPKPLKSSGALREAIAKAKAARKSEADNQMDMLILPEEKRKAPKPFDGTIEPLPGQKPSAPKKIKGAIEPLPGHDILEMTIKDDKNDLSESNLPYDVEHNSDELSTIENDTASREPTNNSVITTWTVRPVGILDRSSTKSHSLDEDHLSLVSQSTDIFTVLLDGNTLNAIPMSLSVISSTLTTLSITRNELSADTYLSSSLSLPSLHSLSLASNTFTSLLPLYTFLNAPNLERLDVSFNRITYIPVSPALRSVFPKLTTLLASDNYISEVPVDALKGLAVLDLSSNEIGLLPPRLGYLSSLHMLRVGSNRFRVPKHTLLDRGTDAVMSWLRDRVPPGEEGDVD